MIDSGRTEERDGAPGSRPPNAKTLGIHDDKNRVMRKVDGTFTYFVPDVAYHLPSSSAASPRPSTFRAPTITARLPASAAASVLQALARQMSIPKEFPEYILHKMLSVVKDGEPVKMSKRSGNYVALRDLVDMAGQDAARCSLPARPMPNSSSTSTSPSRRATKTPSTICSTPTPASAPCLRTPRKRATKFRPPTNSSRPISLAS